MARKAICTLLVSLALAVLAPRSEAQLGCAQDVLGGVATCAISADCASVGGTACTANFCLCDGGIQGVFCPCAAAEPAAAMAPALSRGGQLAMIGLLCAVGIFGMWRRRAANPSASA